MTDSSGKICIVHAFSRRNSGDGLLVDLTLEALAEAGFDAERCCVFALDPESFADLGDVRRVPGEPTARVTPRLIGAIGELAANLFGAGRLAREISRARGVVAVGGGYLVANSLVRQAGVSLNHLAQLRAAARFAGPSVYLPQSIGPLRGLVGQTVRRELADIDRIWVRDDRTLAELALPNARRCPDLAVMHLARRGAIGRVDTSGSVVLVGRHLPAAGDYVERLLALDRMLANAVWAVQADVPGPRSDRTFYRRLSIADSGSLGGMLETPTGPVVSVRLHGAIAALLAGRPAIHLAYERKGWGAFEDLGLEAYVHDARTFDPAAVARQAEALAADAAPYWALIDAAHAKLRKSWGEMVADLAGRFSKIEEAPCAFEA